MSVYVTMYQNDHQRREFYETLGMNVDHFDRHVITETNNTTERIFPVVPDTSYEGYWPCMERIRQINEARRAMDRP